MSASERADHNHHPLSEVMQYVQCHPVLANLLLIGVLLVGFVLGRQINVQSMPDFPWPTISVRVNWSGANAQEVYENITRPLTSELRATSDLRTLESFAMPGYGFIVLDFRTGTDLTNAFDEIRNTLAKTDLPSGSEAPIISEVMLHDPLLKLILYSDQLETLRYWANAAKRSLLSEYGMDKVRIIGLPDQNLNINLRAIDIHRLQLPITTLTDEIAQSSNQQPIGRLETNDLNITMRAPPRPKVSEEVEEKVIQLRGQAYRVGDISQLDLENETNQPTITYQQQPAVILEVERSTQNGGDSLQLVEQFYEWYQQAAAQWPSSIQSRVFLKEYQLIHQRLNMLLENGIWGIVGIGILLVILIQWRLAFWIAMGIPTAIVGALIVMYMLNMSINFLSTFGFIMALGLIVDDTIVVAENAYANFQAGEKPVDAVKTAMNQMFPPVLAASLTTISAFIPLLVMQSRYAVFLQDIPKVVIAVIIASLIECFFILPHHITGALQAMHSHTQGPVAAWIDAKQLQFHKLKVLLQSIAARAWITLSIVAFVVVFPIVLLLSGQVPYNFIPYIARDHIALDVEFYPGTTRGQMQAVMASAQKALMRADRVLTNNQSTTIQTPIVKYQLPAITTETAPVYAEQQSDHASIVVELTPPSQRKISNSEIKRAWEQQLEQFPTVKKITVKEAQSDTEWQDVNLLITGDDWDTLARAAEEAKRRLSAYSAVYNITDNSALGGAEYEVTLKPTARMLGLTKQSLSRQLQQVFQGGEVTVNNLSGNEQLTIQVTIDQQDIQNAGALESMPITIGDQQMALGDLAELSIKHRPAVYYLRNGALAIKVGADVDRERVSASLIRQKIIKEELPAIQRAHNVSIQESLQSPDEKDAIDEITTGSIVAVIAIYFVLAWVSRSYWWPFAMMVVIPIGFSGAVFGHYVMQADFSLLSMIAIFGLSGVVVNTAIILFNQYQRLCVAYPKRSHCDQVIHAICHRARAIVLTTLTTTLGLAPILMETSQQAKWVHPFAISIIFGLGFAVVTLCLALPAVVALVEKSIPRESKK